MRNRLIDKGRPDLGYVRHTRRDTRKRNDRPTITTLDGYEVARYDTTYARQADRASVTTQLTALHKNIEHLTRQLRKASRKGDAPRMYKLAAMLTKQRGRFLDLANKFETEYAPQ